MTDKWDDIQEPKGKPTFAADNRQRLVLRARGFRFYYLGHSPDANRSWAIDTGDGGSLIPMSAFRVAGMAGVDLAVLSVAVEVYEAFSVKKPRFKRLPVKSRLD